jgi:hypothetical protein
MDSSKLILLAILYVALPGFEAQIENGYIFTMPKVLRFGSISEYCLTLHGQNKTSQNITMKLYKKKLGKIITEVKDIFHVGKQKCSKFLVPAAGKYKLSLTNETDVMQNDVAVTIFGEKLITLIQTDKPIYKPGQKVKFRVLTLMSNLKPRIGKIKSILVIDPHEIRVKQYLDVDTKGISSLELQLAAEVRLGTWKIEIVVDETDDQAKQVAVREFKVMEYVLPQIEVEIKSPPYILYNQKDVNITVCAKYTYGKNVTGLLDVNVCFVPTYPTSICFRELVPKITGCHSFSASFFEEMHGFYNQHLQIEALVIEEGTEIRVNKSQSIPTQSYHAFNIKLDDYSNGFFKPGLPFYGKAIVTQPDGSPIEGKLIIITAIDRKNNLEFSKTFKTDSYGHIVYSLCGSFTEKSASINIFAQGSVASGSQRLVTQSQNIKQWFSPSLSYIQIPRTDSSHKCGDRLTLSIPFTTQARRNVEFNYQVMAQGKIIKTGQISYDEATSYPGKDLILPPLDICLQDNKPTTSYTTTSDNPVTESTEKNETADGIVETAVEEREYEEPKEPRKLPGFQFPHYFDYGYNHHYEEPIVLSENVSDVVSNFLLDLPIEPIMSPKFTLLVYHIMPDGEVVADSMQFLVNPCFVNKVSMEFNRTTVLPGEVVDINLKATPGSVCGVGIVDKSVNILGGKHQITPELVFEKIEEFNTAQYAQLTDYSYFITDLYCEARIRKVKGEHDYHHFSSSFVDSLQAFKSSGFMVLTNLDLETRPCGAEHAIAYAMMPAPLSGYSGTPPGGPPLSQNIIRSNFPDTWLWDLHIIGESGEIVLKEEAPHTITSWVGNAMCLDQEKGFGISRLISLTTFQPFFLSLNLPYAAVRGERLPIMFTVRSYLDKCLHIQLTLELGKSFKIHNSKQHQDAFCVCGGNSYTADFYATPTDIGNLPVFAKAEVVPGLCGNTSDIDTTYVGLSDAVKRQMLVKAEGVEQQYTHTSFICSKVDEPVEESVILAIPGQGEMVKDSARGEVQVIGDIMGPALSNLNNLVKMPTGCGEQNMAGFVPNIVVLKYLTSINKVSQEIKEKAINFMEIGYQRQLTYQHKDGSYSAFGSKHDLKGSVWLSAFVVKSYAQAEMFVYIDDKDLTRSLKFLRFNQLETGCFRETGRVFDSYMMGGLGASKDNESNTALTAYVLIALLTAKVNSTEPVIFGAFSCINNDFELKKEKMDPYTLALVFYANSLHEPNSHDIMRVIESKAHKEGPVRYWSRETSKPEPTTTWDYHPASSAEVEITSYVLMAYINLLGKRSVERTHDIAIWLSQQRNPNGGFSSTQDTVIGLQALSEFASLAYNKEGSEMHISVSGKQLNHSFSVSESERNTLLLQSAPISVLPNSLTISARGAGCALVQATVRYNKQPKDIQADERPKFHLKVSTKRYQHNIDACNRATISISVGKKGNSEDANGMSLVTVKMVTSWTPLSDSLEKLKFTPGMKRTEYDEEQGLLTLYFDQLSRRSREFTIDVEQATNLAVSNPKPADVKVYQYYEADVFTYESYVLKKICGTKAEIPLTSSIADGELGLVQARVNLNPIPGPDRSEHDVCPVCIPIKQDPKNLKDMICNSPTIYKAIAGRKGAYPLKLMQNMQSQIKEKLNIFANYKMASGCDCTVLDAPVKRVILFVSQEVSSDHTLVLDRNSLVLLSDKQIERQVRKIKKSCSS